MRQQGSSKVSYQHALLLRMAAAAMDTDGQAGLEVFVGTWRTETHVPNRQNKIRDRIDP